MSSSAIPAEPVVPPSTWSIIKRSRVIALGIAFVITCLICAGSIQIFILYMDATIKAPSPSSVLADKSLNANTPDKVPDAPPNPNPLPLPPNPNPLPPPPNPNPIIVTTTSDSDSESEPSVVVDSPEPETKTTPRSVDDDNLLVIPFPKPENISSVVNKVRKVAFTSPFRSAVVDNEISKEDVSHFSYRNLLAIQQVFTKSLLQYRFGNAEQVWIDKLVHKITDFIRWNVHLVRDPRSIPGSVHEFPDVLDEFTDRFVDEPSRWLFYREFLRYQKIWNDQVVPLLMNKLSLSALNGAFNSAVKSRYSKLVNAVTLPAMPNSANPYINPNYNPSIFRKHNITITDLLAKIKNRIKGILAANKSNAASSIQDLMSPLKDYKLSDTEQLDYQIALLNLLVDRYPQPEKRDS